MATFTQQIEKTTRTTVEFSSAEILKLFMDQHPELAGQDASLFIQSSYRQELHSDTPQPMDDDLKLIVVTVKKEITGG
jgi:hypothetical protein